MDTKNIELIARRVLEAMEERAVAEGKKTEKKEKGTPSPIKQAFTGVQERPVPVGVSARHVHLTKEHVEALFGTGYRLTKKKDLMGGQYASNEIVTIVGLKLRAIENVRILGPVRKASQVEISATDAVRLGVNAPVRESGNLEGSAPIAIVGPKGDLYLKEGCIIAKRHIHMSPADAKAFGVGDGDTVSVRADNERGTIFGQVTIRVDDSFTLEMHIDTDEANASRIATGSMVTLIREP